MNKKIVLASILLLVGAIALSGCVKAPTEKANEKLLENALGQDADVNIEGNTYKVNVNGVEIEAGENVVMPQNFPNDIYLPQGTLLSSMVTEMSLTLSMEAEESPTDLFALYQEKISAENWKVVTSGNFGDILTLTAEKENRILSVTVSQDENQKTILVLAQYLKEEE
jgi:hypothetical protein